MKQSCAFYKTIRQPHRIECKKENRNPSRTYTRRVFVVRYFEHQGLRVLSIYSEIFAAELGKVNVHVAVIVSAQNRFFEIEKRLGLHHFAYRLLRLLKDHRAGKGYTSMVLEAIQNMESLAHFQFDLLTKKPIYD